MPSAVDRFDWYQSDKDVTVNYFRKNVTPSQLKVTFGERSVYLVIIGPDGDEFNKCFNLTHAINSELSSYKCSSVKIELRLRKMTDLRWDKLEMEPSENADETTNDVAKVAHSYPSSSKVAHDWNKLEKEADELEDEADPLNKLFRTIYKDATDETRKAMEKSFTESGGTVLSTNWNEVGKGNVDMKPPDGMEYKKYEL